MMRRLTWLALLLPWLPVTSWAGEQVYPGTGVITGFNPQASEVVIRHEAMAGYMPAMTMPFAVHDRHQLVNRQAGDLVTFDLHVTESNSWVENLQLGNQPPGPVTPPAPPPARPPRALVNLSTVTFTNEMGQPVHLSDFRGQVVALTFIYTRCPLPDYCPRLSKNFAVAAQTLAAQTNLPTNWHFLSVTLDPEFDTPAQLQAYARSYQYDSRHWHFLTGPTDALAAFAKQAGVESVAEGTGFNHNFRTLIIDGQGQVQTVFPTSGDLAAAIAQTMTVQLRP